jgi:hypothetical protein
MLGLLWHAIARSALYNNSSNNALGLDYYRRSVYAKVKGQIIYSCCKMLLYAIAWSQSAIN